MRESTKEREREWEREGRETETKTKTERIWVSYVYIHICEYDVSMLDRTAPMSFGNYQIFFHAIRQW